MFSYCSWGSQGQNTEVVCHSLLQWTTFCQALTSRDMPFSHSMWLDDTSRVLVVPLLVLIEWVNLHCVEGVSQCEAWGQSKGPAGMAGRGSGEDYRWCWMMPGEEGSLASLLLLAALKPILWPRNCCQP